MKGVEGGGSSGEGLIRIKESKRVIGRGREGVEWSHKTKGVEESN